MCSVPMITFLRHVLCITCVVFFHYINVIIFRLDATLKELTSLVKEVNTEARKKGTFFDFAIVYPDTRTVQYRLRKLEPHAQAGRVQMTVLRWHRGAFK